MKAPKIGARKLRIAAIILLVVLLVAAGAFLVIKKLDKKSEISETTKSSLLEGKCSDSERDEVEKSANQEKDETAKAALFENLANCYIYRIDYNSAIEAYTKAAEYYAKVYDIPKENAVKSAIENLKKFKDMPKTIEEDTGADGALSN